MLSEPQTRINIDAQQPEEHPVAEAAQALPVIGPSREQIEHLESHMLGFPQVEIPATHRFAPDLYMREIRIPPDTLMTGRVHRFEHVSVMVSGEMTTLVDGQMQRIEGYHPFIAPAGTKRVGYTHTEVVWLTVHLNPDELREPAQLEAMLCEPMHLTPDACRLARDSFTSFLLEYDIDVALMREQVCNASDLAPFPPGDWGVRTKSSPVHGTGLFAERGIDAGSLIAPARVGGFRTPAGRFTNHSHAPNARMVRNGENIDLVATEMIAPGEEVFIDYRRALQLSMQGDECPQ